MRQFNDQVMVGVLDELVLGYDMRYDEETNRLAFIPMLEDRDIIPTFKMDKFYQLYLQQGMDIGEIVDVIAEEVLKPVDDAIVKIAQSIKSYDNVHDRICGYVVNTARNEEFLKDKPHKDILDLSMVFIFVAGVTDDAYKTIPVTNELAESWDVTVDDLYEEARKNTEKVMGLQCIDIFDCIRDMCAKKDPELGAFMQEKKQELKASGAPIINVVTNDIKIRGAGMIFLTDIVKKFSDEIKGDVKIIPSSVHEMLLVPTDSDISSEKIAEVNGTDCMADDEVLSDHPYIYIRSIDQIVSCE